VTSARPLLRLGAVLAGRWLIQDFVGAGDTGEVYGVRDMHGTSTFALKLFWPNALGQTELWSAVQQTSRAASGLNAEGIARAFDFGIDANSNRPFVVAERVTWASLDARVRQSGPLSPAEMATALHVLGRALDAAHAAGVVHRGLKPENVFIAADNAAWVRITDFGASLLRCASPPPPGWAGRLGWVGPDAADPNARATPAMDIYTLGLLTFFALSGGALQRAARESPIDAGALWHELNLPLDSASARARELGASIDPAFDAWFQRALAPEAEGRFASAGEMALAFGLILRSLVDPNLGNAAPVKVSIREIGEPPLLGTDTLLAPLPRVVFDESEHSTTVSESVPVRLAPRRKSARTPIFLAFAVLSCALLAVGAIALFRSREAADAHERMLSVHARLPARVNASISAAIAARPASALLDASTQPDLASALINPRPVSELKAVRETAISVTPEATRAPSPAIATLQRVASPAIATLQRAASPASTGARAPQATENKSLGVAPLKAVPLPLPKKKKCQSTFIPCPG
jgi:serine/threonine protein kinase